MIHDLTEQLHISYIDISSHSTKIHDSRKVGFIRRGSD